MKRGFTLLEVLVATALTAVLLLAVFAVIGSLGKSRLAMAQPTDDGAWRTDLLATLRRDLADSVAIAFQPDGITLTGHGALRPDTLAVSHEPVTVTYRIADIRGRRWLVRIQTSRVSLSNDSGWTELLCPDVTAFSVRSAGVIGSAAAGSDAAASSAVPPVVLVALAGPGGSLINETLVLR